MKKSVYAVVGATLIVIATLTRTFADGGPELFALLILGIVMLIASADLPNQATKGQAR